MAHVSGSRPGRQPGADWLMFLGAGASVPAPAMLPAFEALARGVLGAIGWERVWDKNGTGWWRHASYPEFESDAVAAEVLFGTLHMFGVPFAGQVARVLSDPARTPNVVHHVAAVVLANGGMVWTTNVDLMVERASAALYPAPARAGRAADKSGGLLAALREAGPGTLVKFHGTAEAPATLAFTDRELMTPLPRADVDHLAELARGKRIILYGYAGADADLAGLLDAAFEVAAEVVWYEPVTKRRDDIREAFPAARLRFAPGRHQAAATRRSSRRRRGSSTPP